VKYKDPQELLEKEGLQVLSTLVTNIEEGVELLYSFHEYKEMIPKHGIFAIHIKPLN
jgi:ASC-1-like (ASCH) protein